MYIGAHQCRVHLHDATYSYMYGLFLCLVIAHYPSDLRHMILKMGFTLIRLASAHESRGTPHVCWLSVHVRPIPPCLDSVARFSRDLILHDVALFSRTARH